jgi:hypothetical protein
MRAILFDFMGVLLFSRPDYEPDELLDAIDRRMGQVTDSAISPVRGRLGCKRCTGHPPIKAGWHSSSGSHNTLPKLADPTPY